MNAKRKWYREKRCGKIDNHMSHVSNLKNSLSLVVVGYGKFFPYFIFHSITVRMKHDLFSIEKKRERVNNNSWVMYTCTIIIIIKCFEAQRVEFDRTRKCDRINDTH